MKCVARLKKNFLYILIHNQNNLRIVPCSNLLLVFLYIFVRIGRSLFIHILYKHTYLCNSSSFPTTFIPFFSPVFILFRLKTTFSNSCLKWETMNENLWRVGVDNRVFMTIYHFMVSRKLRTYCWMFYYYPNNIGM